METNEKLKPCPFCGGEAEIVEDHLFGEDYYAGRCRSCAATSIFEFTKEEAVAAWNRRNYPEKQDSSNLTYADVEKIVKPLEWDEGTGLWAADICEFSTFQKKKWYQPQFSITKERENSYLVEIFGMFGFFSKSLDDAKQAARKLLVDLVAAALGVERSGK